MKGSIHFLFSTTYVFDFFFEEANNCQFVKKKFLFESKCLSIFNKFFFFFLITKNKNKNFLFSLIALFSQKGNKSSLMFRGVK